MKARLIKKILNNTGYIVGNYGEYIAVGSPLCHDLISVNKQTLKVKLGLDTFHKGRAALEGAGKSGAEMLFIYNKLEEMIASGEIVDIINGDDVLENPLPVFTFRLGKIVETTTEKYGWPNVDNQGYVLHDNSSFKTRRECIQYAIKEIKYAIENDSSFIKERTEQLDARKHRKAENENTLNALLDDLNKLNDL